VATKIGGLQVTGVSGAVEMWPISVEYQSFDDFGYCDQVRYWSEV